MSLIPDHHRALHGTENEMTGIACVCCANPMDLLDTYKEYTRYRCGSCGYERFKNDGVVQSSDYEDDSDYLDDIAVYPNVDDRILWHHKKALSFIDGSLGMKAEVLDVGCFDGFFITSCNCGCLT